MSPQLVAILQKATRTNFRIDRLEHAVGESKACRQLRRPGSDPPATGERREPDDATEERRESAVWLGPCHMHGPGDPAIP